MCTLDLVPLYVWVTLERRLDDEESRRASNDIGTGLETYLNKTLHFGSYSYFC